MLADQRAGTRRIQIHLASVYTLLFSLHALWLRAWSAGSLQDFSPGLSVKRYPILLC